MRPRNVDRGGASRWKENDVGSADGCGVCGVYRCDASDVQPRPDAGRACYRRAHRHGCPWNAQREASGRRSTLGPARLRRMRPQQRDGDRAGKSSPSPVTGCRRASPRIWERVCLPAAATACRRGQARMATIRDIAERTHGGGPRSSCRSVRGTSPTPCIRLETATKSV